MDQKKVVYMKKYLKKRDKTIEGNPNPGFIYKNNNHIAIDCGAHYPGGRLAAICLDTMEAFYVGTGC